MSTVPIPPILSLLISHIAAAVPRRARITFTELLIGAAATRGGRVTDGILAAGLSRSWTTYDCLLQRGRWTWLAVWQALLRVLKMLFDPPVWHVVLDDTLVERISARAPGSLIHHNHTAKPNRPRFLRGQGWLCLAAVVEHEWKVGAVPLMLRLVRRGPHRGKLKSAGLPLRLLGNRLGRVRVLLDAWFMRAWLIERTLAASHTVIGRVRRDLALYEVPKLPGPRGRGRPRKYGARMTRQKIEAQPVHRTAQILCGNPEVVRYRTCCVAARFLKGRVVRAAWVQLEQPDRGDQPAEERLLICTDPDLSAITVITSYAKRWSIEPLFAAIKHGWGLKDAWQAVAPGADALGDHSGRELRAQSDAGPHRPGPHPGSRRPGPLAASRGANGRADPGRHHADFTRGRPAGPHGPDLAKISPPGRSRRPRAGVRRPQSRLSQHSRRPHADHAAAVRRRGQIPLPVNFSFPSMAALICSRVIPRVLTSVTF